MIFACTVKWRGCGPGRHLHALARRGVFALGVDISLAAVTLARDLGTTVEIAAGVSPGDAVITNPPDSLANGELVRVASPERAPN